MPSLKFRLTNRELIFSGTEGSDEWYFYANGKCERSQHSTSFKVKCGNNVYDGFGADTAVFIEKRPPRSEERGMPTAKPFDKDDEYRDLIHVTCSDSEVDQLFFKVSISLPPDAYQRVIDTDWTKEVLTLLTKTNLKEQVLVYGNDPDGREIEWLADKEQHVFLEEVSISFLAATQKDNPEKKKSQSNEEVENTFIPIDKMLASVERATESIGKLRDSIIRAAWVLAIVFLITMFIR